MPSDWFRESDKRYRPGSRVFVAAVPTPQFYVRGPCPSAFAVRSRHCLFSDSCILMLQFCGAEEWPAGHLLKGLGTRDVRPLSAEARAHREATPLSSSRCTKSRKKNLNKRTLCHSTQNKTMR